MKLDKAHAEDLASRAREHLANAQGFLEELQADGFDVKIKDTSQRFPTPDDATVIDFQSDTTLDVRAERRVSYTEEV